MEEVSEMATLVASVLSTYLNVLVKDFNKNQLSLGFFSGKLALKNARKCFSCYLTFVIVAVVTSYDCMCCVVFVV